MPPPTSSDLIALALADGRLPTGSHTQSSGLEPALLGGLDPDGIADFIATRLATVVPVDAGTAVVARHHVLAGLPVADVETAWAARTPSQVVRAASRAVGRGQRRLLLRLWPGSAAATALTGLPAPARPVALGALAAAAGLDAPRTAGLAAYEDVQGACAAALKLCPLDPADAAAWLVEAAPRMAAVVERVSGLVDPQGIPSGAAPLMEAWQHRHAHAPRRLFSA